MSEPKPGRLFGRKRRENADKPRDRVYRVYVTPDEDVHLQARAVVRDVTVPRFLFESAMSADVQTSTDRQEAIAEMFAIRKLLANIANNTNQLAKFANTEGAFPAEAESIITEYRAIVPRLSEAMRKLTDS